MHVIACNIFQNNPKNLGQSGRLDCQIDLHLIYTICISVRMYFSCIYAQELWFSSRCQIVAFDVVTYLKEEALSVDLLVVSIMSKQTVRRKSISWTKLYIILKKIQTIIYPYITFYIARNSLIDCLIIAFNWALFRRQQPPAANRAPVLFPITTF